MPHAKVIKREVVTNNFFHFCTHFFLKIGGVIFWQRENFSSEEGYFYNKNCTKNLSEIWIFNKPLKSKSSKKSQNQTQSFLVDFALEKSFIPKL